MPPDAACAVVVPPTATANAGGTVAGSFPNVGVSLRFLRRIRDDPRLQQPVSSLPFVSASGAFGRASRGRWCQRICHWPFHFVRCSNRTAGRGQKIDTAAHARPRRRTGAAPGRPRRAGPAGASGAGPGVPSFLRAGRRVMATIADETATCCTPPLGLTGSLRCFNGAGERISRFTALACPRGGGVRALWRPDRAEQGGVARGAAPAAALDLTGHRAHWVCLCCHLLAPRT